MTDSATAVLTSAELDDLLRRTDPQALLVPPRILRRVIKKDRGLAGLGLQVPHRKSYVIRRDTLLRIADRDELGVAGDQVLPEILLLLPQPDAAKLAQRGPGRTLVKYWRLLFHARVHRVLDQLLAAGKLTEEVVRQRIRALGLTEFDEVRAVLRQEHFLLPAAAGGELFAEYSEFAALYLELRHFAPRVLPAYFPTMEDLEATDAVLAQDVDAAELFTATRLPGAPAPAELDAPEQLTDSQPPAPAVPGEGPPDSRAVQRLLDKAASAAAHGNVVRAAINHTRAGAEAGADLDALAARFSQGLALEAGQAAGLRAALEPLLAPAAHGVWAVEARFLYDLQKVCIDQEREVFAVDLVEWAVSWGRKPVFRLLPYHQDLLTVKHLRAALRRLTAVRIPDADRSALGVLLHGALEHRERLLRDRLRPAVVHVLDEVGLTPANVAEAVSRDKLVEELLDRALERNFLTMGDLRDAIARNRVKLPDLINPVTFITGDKLLRANRGMARALDGIYHRGEIYLRWLQRLSSLAFGNPIGRFLTRYLVLPFGSSFMLLKMWEEIDHLLFGPKGEWPDVKIDPDDWSDAADDAVVAGIKAAVQPSAGVNLQAFLILGVFLFLLLHVPPFRRGVVHVLRGTWWAVRGLLYDLPSAFLRLPWVRQILQSRWYLVVFQLVLKPLPWGVLAGMGLCFARAGPWVSFVGGVIVFALASVVLQSRIGLYLEEVCADGLIRTWHLIHSDLLPGLVRWVLYIFRRLVEEVERFLYTVDEWLRFRSGDSRLSLYVKPVLGLVWFFFTYLVRIVINLFVEPTFNPIKHFPVVTVTAKLIAPFYPELLGFFMRPLRPVLGKWAAGAVATAEVGLLPGLGGFLAWEFKENWKLYRANQSPTLDPELVGHHGETVLRLMRPGLHSGTLPKLYAKLRRAKGRSARRQREGLLGVKVRLHEFVERDLLAILHTSKTWSGAPPVHVGVIHLGTNRVRIELRSAGESLFLDFEHHAGWLLGGTFQAAGSPGWLVRLSPQQLLVIRDALAGFYKLAGVDLVREEIAACLQSEAAFDVTEQGLEVWPACGKSDPIETRPLTTQDREFAATPIRWQQWAEAWERDHRGEGHPALVPAQVRILPCS
jgi:hypothetical protein